MMTKDDKARRGTTIFHKAGPVEKSTLGPVTDISETNGFHTDKRVEPHALEALR